MDPCRPPAFLTPDAALAVSPYSFHDLDTFQSPRCFKTHLHYSLLPKQLQEGTTGAKIVYVTRNPKDACLSWFHHSCALQAYKGTLDEFVQHFTTDNGNNELLKQYYQGFNLSGFQFCSHHIGLTFKNSGK